MVRLKSMKTCKCGQAYDAAPDSALVTPDGVWWNCRCGSTLFVLLGDADAVSLLKHQAGFREEETESCGHDNLDDEGGCVECKASRDELRAEFDADMACDKDQAERDST